MSRAIVLLFLLLSSAAGTSSSAAAQTTCESLWTRRNAIYREAGYCFRTPKAISVFGNDGCRHAEIVDLPLSDRDRRSIAEIARMEAAARCGSETVAPAGVRYPKIVIRFDLTPAARRKLVDNGESIHLSATYFGYDKPEGDEIFLGKADLDVSPEQLLATVPAGMFERRIVDRIYDRNPQVNINIFSSRQVFKDNVIDCGSFEDTVEHLAREVQVVACRMIGEKRE